MAQVKSQDVQSVYTYWMYTPAILYIMQYRAGFSWWEAWGPAIGVKDGGRGVSPPQKKKKILEKK